MTTTYTGSCHCGNVAFEAEGTIDSGLACNCSICARRASLLWFVPRASLRMTTPDDAAGSYMFNKHVIRHRFCPTCGIHVFGEGTDPKGNAVAAVNLRCVAGIDLAAIPVHNYDGKAV
ncbi:MAG: GFA family protein [Pseudomonadota bacterium]